jgi:hypothetical protein
MLYVNGKQQYLINYIHYLKMCKKYNNRKKKRQNMITYMRENMLFIIKQLYPNIDNIIS